MKDHYKVLMISPNAPQEMIKKAYYVLAQKYHPDKNSKAKQEWANEQMRELNEAYTVLSEPARRAIYDEELQKQERSYHDRYTETAVNQSAVTGEPVFIVSGNAEQDWLDWGKEIFDTKSEFMDTVYYEQKGERMRVPNRRSWWPWW